MKYISRSKLVKSLLEKIESLEKDASRPQESLWNEINNLRFLYGLKKVDEPPPKVLEIKIEQSETNSAEYINEADDPLVSDHNTFSSAIDPQHEVKVEEIFDDGLEIKLEIEDEKIQEYIVDQLNTFNSIEPGTSQKPKKLKKPKKTKKIESLKSKPEETPVFE
jgi:hypothetical protein